MSSTGARLSAAIALAAWALPAAAQDAPREIGLVERSGRRLAQIDISAIGPPEVVRNLTADDFRIRVRFERIAAFTLDRHCPESDAAPPDEPGVAVPGGAPATFMLYFDQPHLTLGGRQMALGLARELIPQLIRDGNQAMIVSNNRELLVVEPLTTDAGRLIAGLERLEGDRTQYDTFAEQEDERVAEVARALNEQTQPNASVDRATSVARRYQVEEVWRAEHSLRRLSMTLQRLSDAPPPKAVLYFADTMRANPGEHYLSFFGQRLRDTRVALLNIASDALMARSPFDRVVTDAVGLGIRFYPVLARGMGADLEAVMPTASAISRSGGSPASSRTRHVQASESLATLASETGGEAFLQGQRAARVVERIERDFGCLYVASFDPPADWPEDEPLRVVVSTTREGVELRSRGQLVLLSESTRTAARLLNAFADSSDRGRPAERVRASIVPTGFRDHGFTALLQITAPGLALPAATWDLGASVIHGEKVVHEVSGRMAVTQPDVPVVYEAELEFKHGDYEIVAVAHELTTGIVAAHRLHVSWPDPTKHASTVTPIALLQPAVGAFLRSEHTRLAGSLAQDPAEPVHTERATALVGLVCQDGKRAGPLDVERRLVGETTVDFSPLSLDLGTERCAQLRDLVPAGGLGEGYYRYEIRVSSDGETLFRGAREFVAVAPPR